MRWASLCTSCVQMCRLICSTSGQLLCERGISDPEKVIFCCGSALHLMFGLDLTLMIWNMTRAGSVASETTIRFYKVEFCHFMDREKYNLTQNQLFRVILPPKLMKNQWRTPGLFTHRRHVHFPHHPPTPHKGNTLDGHLISPNWPFFFFFFFSPVTSH